MKPSWNAPTRSKPVPCELSSIVPTELDGIADLDHGDQPAADVVVGELDDVALAACDVRRPRAGEAVGLLLFEDRRLPELVGPELHGMAELVRQHDGDRRLTELVDELRQQVGVVVGHEVAVDAVERVALHVARRGVCGVPQPGIGSVRSG